MIKDDVALTGALTIKINDKVVKEVKNLVVDTGKQWVASMMAGTGAAIDGMQIGNTLGTPNTYAAGATDIALETTDAADIQTTTTTAVEGTTDKSVTFSATFAPTENGVATPAGIVEAGLFAGAVMLARTEFPIVNKGEKDSMSITWKITVS